jgi:hypothetical protein
MRFDSLGILIALALSLTAPALGAARSWVWSPSLSTFRPCGEARRWLASAPCLAVAHFGGQFSPYARRGEEDSCHTNDSAQDAITDARPRAFDVGGRELQQTGDTSQPIFTTVKGMEEWNTALDAGARDIEVIDHIDASSFPKQEATINGVNFFHLLRPQVAKTRSIRV